MHARRGWLVASVACALVLYALLWIGFAQRWAWVDAIDRPAIDAMFAYGTAHPGWVQSWDLFCTVLGPTAFRLVALVVVVVALTRRNVRTALFLVISVELGGLVTETAKAAANRPRPAEALVQAPSTSFPSGHAQGVMVGVLAFLTLLLPVVRRPLRVLLVALGVLIVVAIGAGRVVLCVHHPSDVLAGWALGYVWFVVCLMLVPPAKPVTAADETPAAHGSSR
ncbi:PAP2 family protein [Mycolicibacterium moriokaense]|nr:PAP2 family protein [Mycolicibacterium moriokaense]